MLTFLMRVRYGTHVRQKRLAVVILNCATDSRAWSNDFGEFRAGARAGATGEVVAWCGSTKTLFETGRLVVSHHRGDAESKRPRASGALTMQTGYSDKFVPF